MKKIVIGDLLDEKAKKMTLDVDATYMEKIRIVVYGNDLRQELSFREWADYVDTYDLFVFDHHPNLCLIDITENPGEPGKYQSEQHRGQHSGRYREYVFFNRFGEKDICFEE